MFLALPFVRGKEMFWGGGEMAPPPVNCAVLAVILNSSSLVKANQYLKSYWLFS